MPTLTLPTDEPVMRGAVIAIRLAGQPDTLHAGRVVDTTPHGVVLANDDGGRDAVPWDQVTQTKK